MSVKVVFVASLSSSSASGLQRLWALKQCNAEVSVINKQIYKPLLGRWSGHLAKLLKTPSFMLDTTALQKEVLVRCKQIHPDIIWLEWPREASLADIKEIKRANPQALLVSFQDDNPWGDRSKDVWMWKNYFKLIPEFDVHLVKRTSDIENLKRLGAKESVLWKHGMYSPLFYPPTEAKPKKYPVSFVGTCMDNRIELIRFLLEQGIHVHVFGNRWDKRSNLPERFPDYFHGEVEGEAYAEVIRQSQVCLGLVSHSNRDEWTMRTYEVPACAGLLLAEKTEEHKILFREGIDAVFFKDKTDCATILLTLLSNQQQCAAMGRSAFEAFKRNEYSLEARMYALIGIFKNMLNNRRK